MSFKEMKMTPEQYDAMYKELGTDAASFEENALYLKRWIDSQPHLPNNIDMSRVRTSLMNRKNDLVKVKERWEAYYSIMKKEPGVFRDRDPTDPELRKMMFTWSYVMIPKLTEDGNLLMLSKVSDPDPSKIDSDLALKMTFLIIDSYLTIPHRGAIGIYDMKNFHSDQIPKVILTLPRMAKIVLSSRFPRIRGFYVLNASSTAKSMVNFAKTFLPRKLKNRVSVYEDGEMDEFFKATGFKSIFPKDYGGDLSCTHDDLVDQTLELAISQKDFFSDENRFVQTLKDVPEDQMHGTFGTFKKLDID